MPFILFEKKISRSDISGLTRYLATLLTAGIPLIKALDLIIKT